jgi:uroporphyrinogen-III synthase
VSKLVLTIRPQPGCSETVAAGKAAGLLIEAYPLFEIWPIEWDAPRPEAIGGLLLGSANALRHGGEALEAFRAKPVHAVGEATAREAEALGFAVASTGRGGLQALVDRLSPPLRLLRITGADHVPLTLPTGIEIETQVAYQSVPFALPDLLARRLAGGAIVLLHSAAAARHFASECDRLAVPRRAVCLAALGSRIGSAAGEGWREVRSAPEPREASLLALAREMCHDPAGD